MRTNLSPLVFSILATVFCSNPAEAAPELFYARCMAIYTAGAEGGPVPEFTVKLLKGEEKEVYRVGDVSFKVAYRNTLAEENVLQFSVSEPKVKSDMGGVVSLFIGNEFPQRFDLTVGSGMLSCELR